MLRNRALPAWSITLLFAVASQAQETKSGFSVDELVSQALERNRDFLAARQRLAEAQGLLRQAGVRLAPTIETEGATGRPLGTRGEEEYSAAFFYPFETGGKRQKRITVAEFGLELAKAEVSERSRQLTFEVKRRALELVGSRRKQDAIERLLKVSRESYEITKVRVDEGDAAPLEQQLLATELARVEVQEATLNGRSAAALLELRQVLGTADGDLSTLSEGSNPMSVELALDAMQTRSLADRPDLRAARLLESQAAAEVELARAQGRADITASARYTRRNSFFDEYFGLTPAGIPSQPRDRDDVLTFGVSIPLFTQRRNVGNVEAALARERATRLRREYLESTVPLEVEAAYRRWAAARRALTLFERGVVDQSEKNVAVIRQAYALGQLRVLDVLVEQRRLIDTQLAYIDARMEFALATAELERAVGGKL